MCFQFPPLGLVLISSRTMELSLAKALFQTSYSILPPPLLTTATGDGTVPIMSSGYMCNKGFFFPIAVSNLSAPWLRSAYH